MRRLVSLSFLIMHSFSWAQTESPDLSAQRQALQRARKQVLSDREALKAKAQKLKADTANGASPEQIKVDQDAVASARAQHAADAKQARHDRRELHKAHHEKHGNR